MGSLSIVADCFSKKDIVFFGVNGNCKDENLLRINSMKHCFTILLTLFVPLFANAFEGVLEYKISSGDRDWKLLCSVKGEWFRAEVYLGDSHFQTIMRNQEGVLLLDEMNRQVFQADYEREKWGKPGELQYKVDDSGKYERVGPFQRDGLQGTVYKVREKRRDYLFELVEGLGMMPGIFLNQFSSLRPFFQDGKLLLSEHPGMPIRIYRKKKESEPLLLLVSYAEQAVDDRVFVVDEGYVRAKMRFKMR